MQQDIVILSETKKKGQGIETQGTYLHLYSGVSKEKRAKRGISIMIKKTYKKYIKQWEAINENMIKLNLNIFGKRIAILGVYGLSEDEPQERKDEFYITLNRVIDEIGDSRELIIYICIYLFIQIA
mgnify:CR=1 FL=1